MQENQHHQRLIPNRLWHNRRKRRGHSRLTLANKSLIAASHRHPIALLKHLY
jgi:hypothetical protein